MKTCFINPHIFPHKKIMRDFDCAGESKGNYLYQPYDLLLMSGFVPEAWDFCFIDAVASKLSEAVSLDLLSSFAPDIIVCSVSGINWNQDLETVLKIRKRHPNSFLFVFGDLFIDEPARKEAASFVDGIFNSPVLFNFIELAKYKNRHEFCASKYEAFYKTEHSVSKNLKAPRKVTIPLSRHKLFLNKSYRWPFVKNLEYTTVFTSWGCPYSCSYCILNKFPNYWRDYKEILSELKHIKNLGIKELYIGDKSFGLPAENTVSLLENMISEDFKFSWSTYFHPNQFSKPLLDLMKKAGCHTIVIGIESKNINHLKQYSRYVNPNNLEDLILYSKKIGLAVCGDFIIGLPHEKKENIIDTISYACNLKIDYASFNIATPLPGSSIKKLALETQKIDSSEQLFDSSGNNKIISLTDISASDLLKLRNFAIRKFYLRPSYLLKRLLQIRSFEHFKIQLDEGIHVVRSSFTQRP